MKKALWRIGLLALPASLFAGSVSLTDGTDPVAISGSVISIGSSCATTCTISGLANVSGLLVNWLFTSPAQITANGSAPNYTLSNGTGTFLINDLPSSGGDSVSGTVSLLSAFEFGPSNSSLDVSGTMTATSLTAPGGLTTTAFLALLGQVGITSPVPPTKTENMVIHITGCAFGATLTACLPANTSATSIQSVGETATVSSVGVSSTVPEPTTMALFGWVWLVCSSGAVWLDGRVSSRRP